MKNTGKFGAIRALAFSFLLTLTLGPAALAQQGGFEIGGDAGFIDLDDELGGEREFRGDFRGGYFFTDRFEVEGQVIRATSLFDLTLTAYMVNGVFHFRSAEETFVPYVFGGVGSANVEFSRLFAPNFDDNGTAFQAGVGARFYFGDEHRGSWRLEASALNEDTFDEDSTHLSLVGGFSWRFGG